MKRSSARLAEQKTAITELRDRDARKARGPLITALYRRAETRLRKQQQQAKAKAAGVKTEMDTQRLLHELQVHHLELEMQNSELQDARNRMEILLEKYTDLYDFAPVGYLSLDEQGQILEVNLNGAALLGVSRARLINRHLPPFLTPASRPTFLAFLKRVFAGNEKQVCEATLLRANGKCVWADFHGTFALSSSGPKKWCRVVVTDITILKRAEEAQRRSDAIAASNEELRQEIERRKAIEESLRKSERNQGEMLEQSRHMQQELRHLSREVLRAQEDERKRISRDLHDVIAQTLTGISVRLANLKREAATNAKGLDKVIARTQELVEHSVELVHQFARELRPTVLDDLGLIPALHTFMKSFRERTGIQVSLSATAAVEELDGDKRIVLYRVAQEALNNVGRHAHANRVEVKITKAGGSICMEIKDDGRGFPVKRMLHAKKNKRLGLLGMSERLDMAGGKFAVESTPGRGTTIVAEIPLANIPVQRRGGGRRRAGPIKPKLHK